MKKRPLKERISCWFEGHYDGSQDNIPIHPEDLDEALKKGMYDRYEIPYRILGWGPAATIGGGGSCAS